MNYLGTRLRQRREQQGLLLRHLATQLNIDLGLMSKLERGERKMQRELVTSLAVALQLKEEELVTLWLADRIQDAIEDEPLASKALELITKKNKG